MQIITVDFPLIQPFALNQQSYILATIKFLIIFNYLVAENPTILLFFEFLII